MKCNFSLDPYVKVSIIYSGKRLKKKKTTALRNTVNPVFNEALTFDISRDTLKHSVIEFLVMHDSLLGANELLGRAVVGNSREVSTEDKQFFDEIFRTKTATAQWISLSDPRNSR
jgi:synaptotagmin-10